MEPTSSSENARQSRGLARFWPSHGVPAPAQRQSDEDIDAAQANEDTPAPAAEAGPRRPVVLGVPALRRP